MVDWLKFIVRASGLVIVIGSTLIMLVASFGNGANVGTIAGCSLVLASCVLSWPRRPNAWRSDPPTERQIAYAESLGIHVAPGLSKGQLSEMISQAAGR